MGEPYKIKITLRGRNLKIPPVMTLVRTPKHAGTWNWAAGQVSAAEKGTDGHQEGEEGRESRTEHSIFLHFAGRWLFPLPTVRGLRILCATDPEGLSGKIVLLSGKDNASWQRVSPFYVPVRIAFGKCQLIASETPPPSM